MNRPAPQLSGALTHLQDSRALADHAPTNEKLHPLSARSSVLDIPRLVQMSSATPHAELISGSMHDAAPWNLNVHSTLCSRVCGTPRYPPPSAPKTTVAVAQMKAPVVYSGP